jgi:hypothetical protein
VSQFSIEIIINGALFAQSEDGKATLFFELKRYVRADHALSRVGRIERRALGGVVHAVRCELGRIRGRIVDP